MSYISLIDVFEKIINIEHKKIEESVLFFNRIKEK